MVGALVRGISLNDFENMTIGMIRDYVINYNNLHLREEDEEDQVREATQADYDNW